VSGKKGPPFSFFHFLAFMTPMPSVFSEAFLNAGFNPTLIELTKFWLGYDYE